MDINCRLVMIGDTAQLPPVGRGSLFFDFVESEKIVTTTLSVVHRQKDGGILDNASIIHNSNDKTTWKDLNYSVNTREEFCFLNETYPHCDDDAGRIEKTVQLVQEIVKTHGYDPYKDIQVIVPKKNETSVCATKLNYHIQPILNPPSSMQKEINSTKAGNSTVYQISSNSSENIIWREKDKVICVKNQYREDSNEWGTKKAKMEAPKRKTLVVANGEQGMIVEVGCEKHHYIDVYFPLTERTERFTSHWEDINYWDCIDLGYAITVHKSQGSEYKTVIFIIGSETKEPLLNRKMLYTGVTRASEHLILVARRSNVSRAMGNGKTDDKQWSLFQQKLPKLY